MFVINFTPYIGIVCIVCRYGANIPKIKNTQQKSFEKHFQYTDWILGYSCVCIEWEEPLIDDNFGIWVGFSLIKQFLSVIWYFCWSVDRTLFFFCVYLLWHFYMPSEHKNLWLLLAVRIIGTLRWYYCEFFTWIL